MVPINRHRFRLGHYSAQLRKKWGRIFEWPVRSNVSSAVYSIVSRELRETVHDAIEQKLRRRVRVR
jgi:hypothetical protein